MVNVKIVYNFVHIVRATIYGTLQWSCEMFYPIFIEVCWRVQEGTVEYETFIIYGLAEVAQLCLKESMNRIPA